MKRIWNKLFGRTTATTSANATERQLDQQKVTEQQRDRQRLQDEMSLREARNTIGYLP